MSSKTSVLIIGASGNTGQSIMGALLKSGQFNISITTRPGSETKPIIEQYRSQGVKVHVVPIPSQKDGTWERVMEGVDVVISAVSVVQVDNQPEMVDAAKAAGVKRFIPCDFGTACIRGERRMFDLKADIRDYIIEKGLGHTFIDVGWWFQLSLPFIPTAKSEILAEYGRLVDLSTRFYGDGNVKNAITDNRDIGAFVERIITDPRTLNRYVFCWAEEWTQTELFDLANKLANEKIVKKETSAAELRNSIDENKSSTEKDPIALSWFEYQNSMWVRGDNVIAKAKNPEYGSALDARELYPDLKLRRLEDYAKEMYNRL